MSTVRIITTKDEAFNNLELWGYPHSKDKFTEVVMLGVFRSKPIAYVFFEYISDCDLLLHAGCNPAYRGVWLTRPVCKKILVGAELFGAERLYVNSKDSYVNKLCDKLGFEDGVLYVTEDISKDA